MAHGGRRWGGGHQRAVLGSLTTGLIWLVTRVGGMGGGVGRWPIKGALVAFLGSLEHLTTGRLAGDEGGGMGGGVGGGPWGGGKGEMGGGDQRAVWEQHRHQRAVWEQQKMHWFPF